MIILGIHVGHNASVFLLDDGVVKAGLSQEKLDDIKNSAAFPADVIRVVLQQANLSPEGIDHIAIAGHQIYPSRCYDYLFKSQPSDGTTRIGIVGMAHKLKGALPRALTSILFAPLLRYRQNRLLQGGRRELEENLQRLGLENIPRTHVEHHTCHARAAFHALNGTGPALIFTADGSGDHVSSTVTSVDERGTWKCLGETGEAASVGGIYSATTRFLGMRPLEHEYKVMGLAPYAKSYADDVYDRVFAPTLLSRKDKPFGFSSSVDTRQFYEYLVDTAVGERFDNIAAAAQRLIEDRVLSWVESSVAKTGIHRAYFSGGLFMNVKLNKRIQELECLENAFFMPSCGDESNALGAAYSIALEAGKVKALDNLYLGVAYTPSAIEAQLEESAKDHALEFERPQNLTETVAQLLADGYVVARFSGANEFGARSLGNRAILAHPGRMESFFTINDQIKQRDFWMPFAPTVLDTSASLYLENWTMERTPAPHMITAFQSTDKGRVDLCAAIHRGDGTLRPQVLTRDVNPDYYDLIKAFEGKTKIGAVLNTSLNLHGKPLAATPSQALDTLLGSDLNYLVLGPFLVRKTRTD